MEVHTPEAQQLDDAWNRFLITLGEGCKEAILEAIRDLRHLERKLVLATYEHAFREARAQLTLEEAEYEQQWQFEEMRLWEERHRAERQRTKSIGCSKCGAEPGQPCLTASGNEYPVFHMVRQEESDPVASARAKRLLVKRALEIATPCSKCGAAPGQDCVTASGNRSSVSHSARREQSDPT